MASRQTGRRSARAADDPESVDVGGTGPEYEYPLTAKDEPIPVVDRQVEYEEEGISPVPGEDAPTLTDKEIKNMEKMEAEEAGEWSEEMAQNDPLPGEEEDTLPEEREELPDDRG